MKSVDVVLVNPGKRTESYQALGSDLAAIEPPVWCCMIAGFLRARGKTVAIIDANAEDLTYRQTAERIAAVTPRITVIVVYGQHPSASTQNMPAAGKVCAAIKTLAPDLPLLMLGGHVAALPERTLREEQTDFATDGEGFHTITGLLGALSSAAPDFAAVPDLWFRENGQPVRSSRYARLLDNLDTAIPTLAWDLLPMHLYRAHNWQCFGDIPRTPYASLYTSLGCPFRCSFCCIQSPFRSGEQASGMPGSKNSYRRWGPAFVVDQLTMLAREYHIYNIKIADELFILNPGHVTAICNGIIEQGLDLNIWAYARVDTLGGIDLALLRKAGIRWLALGIEAASEQVLGLSNKAYRTGETHRTVERLKTAGIHVLGNYIFGLPEDSAVSMQATLDLALDLNCEFANFYCAMAYPGSTLFEEAAAQGLPLPGSWSGFSQLGPDALPLPTRFCTGPEVLAFRDQAFQAYFSSEKYLAAIETTFGSITREQIQAMASVPIKRNYHSNPGGHCGDRP